MREKKMLPAVFKEDLVKLIESINELTPIQNGERYCIVCQKIITIDNLQLIIPRQGRRFEYVCNNPICVDEFQIKKDVK
jgi:hypothetical protein